MKRVRLAICLVGVCVMAVVNVASAELVNGINFLSWEYSASGEFRSSIFTGDLDDRGRPVIGTVQDSYSISPQSNPINYDYTYSYSNIEPGYGDEWGLTWVAIHHNSGHLHVSTYAGVGSPFQSGRVNSYTTGIWDFQPQYSDMELRFNIHYDQGWSESIGSIVLSDLTTGGLLVYQPAIINYWTDYELNNAPFYSVDPTHTYRLTLESRGSAQHDEGMNGGSISANISSVPEPATLLLLGFGLAIAAKRR